MGQFYKCQKYEKGDRLIVTTNNNDNVMVPEMIREFGGKIVTISGKKHVRFGREESYYKIKEDGGLWAWCDNCFSGYDGGYAVEEDVSEEVFEMIRCKI